MAPFLRTVFRFDPSVTNTEVRFYSFCCSDKNVDDSMVTLKRGFLNVLTELMPSIPHIWRFLSSISALLRYSMIAPSALRFSVGGSRYYSEYRR